MSITKGEAHDFAMRRRHGGNMKRLGMDFSPNKYCEECGIWCRDRSFGLCKSCYQKMRRAKQNLIVAEKEV